MTCTTSTDRTVAAKVTSDVFGSSVAGPNASASDTFDYGDRTGFGSHGELVALSRNGRQNVQAHVDADSGSAS